MIASYQGKILRVNGWPAEYVLPGDIPFITTWNTEKAGSATKTIVIPTTGTGYDCYINWGDGSAIEHKVGTPGDITHIYATIGIKTVNITGTFPRIYFNAGGDRLKLLTIAQWGNGIWTNMNNAFNGCGNMTGTYTDVPNTAIVTDMSFMFFGCGVFNSPVNFDTANVTLMISMFQYCTNFNQTVSNFNTTKVISMVNMFYYCNFFNQDISGWSIPALLSLDNILFNATTFSTANYDALLIAWSVQAVQDVVPAGFGNVKYTAGAAATARAHLTTIHLWNITDGGQV